MKIADVSKRIALECMDAPPEKQMIQIANKWLWRHKTPARCLQMVVVAQALIISTYDNTS